MLFIVLGIGSKLIPALLGWGSLPTPESMVKSPKKLNNIQKIIPYILTICLFFGFILEAFGFFILGRILRALGASWIGISLWKLNRFPQQKTKMAFWLWISSWALLFGIWIHALFPKLNIQAAHIFFISGFGLMTMMISSRVILSHGNHGYEKETNSRSYAIVSIVIFISAITRFTAPWTPNYIHHLGYASFCWIVAIIIWSYHFLVKLI